MFLFINRFIICINVLFIQGIYILFIHQYKERILLRNLNFAGDGEI